MDEIKNVEMPDRRRVALKVLSRFVPGFMIVGAVLFLPAGSLAWANGWIFLGTLACLLTVSLIYMLARDPALLEKRMRTRERVRSQKRCVAASFFIIVPLFILPGLDWRFGWSRVPAAIVGIGVALLVAGYALFIAVLRANSFASRVIEVQEGQRVIDGGPYAVVRHHMYVSTIMIYLAAPFVLGSWWALIPAFAFLPFLSIRIRDEEGLLRRDLPGYAEYCARVRWRLFPGVW